MTTKTVVSERWELLPIEKQKLFKSLGYGVLALGAYAVASYLEQFGLPEQLKAFVPLIPVAVNFLQKWAGEHTYVIKK